MKKFLIPLMGVLFLCCWLGRFPAAASNSGKPANTPKTKFSPNIVTCTQPVITIGGSAPSGTVLVCAGGSVTLHSNFVPGNGYLNHWSTGEETQDITVSASGTYSVYSYQPGTCTSATSTAVVVSFQAAPLPVVARASTTTNLCIGDSATLFAPQGYNFYLWSNGKTTRVIKVGAAGKYTVRVANIAGCFSDTTGGYLRAGLTFYPNGAGLDDSITMVLNPSGLCGSLSNASPPDSVWMHSGVHNGNGDFQNTVAANSDATRPKTGFKYANGVYSKTIVPRTYYGLGAGATVASTTQLNMVLGGGAVAGGWFTKEGKDGANSCNNINIPLPIQKASGVAAQGVTVTIKSAVTTPTISLTGNNPFCQGDSVTLTSSSATGGYIWSNGKTTQSIRVGAAGSFSVQTISNGCTSAVSAVTALTRTAKPSTPTITAGGPTAICAPGTVTLTASAGAAYLWSTTETTQSITVGSAGSYTVKIIANGCTSDASVATDVAITSGSTVPSVTASGATTFCQGGSVTLTGPAGFSYIWSNGDLTRSTTVNTSGTYSLIVYTGTCTSASSNATVVTVNPLPSTPTVTVTNGSLSLCTGDNVTLTSSNATGNVWSNGATTQAITVSAAGNYSVIQFDGTCSSVASVAKVVTVTARPLPQVATLSGGATAKAICPGDAVTIYGPAGFSQYKWSNGATTQNITVSAAGHYSVQVANGGGCLSDTTAGHYSSGLYMYPVGGTADDSITLVVDPAATCHQGSALTNSTLVRLYSGATINGGGFSNAQTPDNNLGSAADLKTRFTASGSGWTKRILPRSYYGANANASVTALNMLLVGGPLSNVFSIDGRDQNNGCGDYNFALPVTKTNGVRGQGVDITVKPAVTSPTVSVTGSNPFCAGDSITLTASASAGYLWSTGATTQSIKVRTANSFSVSAVSNGCTSAASSAVVTTITPRPAKPTVTANGPTTFCDAGTVILTSSAATGNVWSTGATTQSITVTTAGSYSVHQLLSGCAGPESDTTDVAITSSSDVPSVTANGPTTFCAGGSVTLTGPGGFSAYLWSNGARTRSITLSSSATVTLQVVTAACTSDASNPIVVTATPLPNTPTVTASGSLSLCYPGTVTLTSSAATGNLWSTGATTQSITVSAAGVYSVSQIVGSCISGVSVAKTVTLTVRPLPVRPTAATATTFCAGGNVTLTAPAGFNFYKWSTGATTRSITVSATGNYNVQVAQSAGCWSDTGAGESINGVSLYPAGATGDDSVLIAVDPTLMQCGDLVNGSPVAMHSGVNGFNYTSAANDGDPAIRTKAQFTQAGSLWVKHIKPKDYYWGYPDPITAINMVLVSGAFNGGWFPHEGKNTNCSNFDMPMPVQNSASVLGFSTIKVTVNPAPAVPTVAQSGGSNPLCQGTALTLTASSATPGATYLWSTTATTAAINIGNPGTYSVVAISNGCTSAASTPVVVTRTAKPATPTVTVTGATTFCNGFGSVTLTSSEATGNVWSTGATTQSITVTSVSGKYTVRKQTGACFSDSSDKVTVTVVDCGYAFLGTTDSDWNTASNWTTGAVPTAADSVNIWPFTANQPVIRFNDNVNVKSLCINSGATLTAEFISSIAISSGFRNNGNFVAGDYSEVDFNAGGTAKIWGTGTFDNLYLSNSTTVKLMGNMSISGVLVVSFNSVLDVNNKVLTLKATDPDNSGKIIAPFAGTIINADNTTAELMLNPANVIPAARGNWHFVAPMVTGQTMAAWNLNNPYNPGTFLPNDSTQKSSLFTYDPTYTQFQSYGGFKKPSALTDAAASGIGVRAWFTPAFYTAGAKMVQTGAPFLGNHTWDLKYCNTNCAYQAAENGYNLIGNPYAASIYWDATGLWNFNDVSSTYWIYDGKQQHYASYVQGLGGTNGATGSIAKGQSFFVKALSASAQLTVMPNATVYNAQGIMRSAAQAKMRLELTDGTYTDEVLMARKAGASRFFNGTEDAEKMWNGGVNLAFTTDKMMSISSSPVNAGDTVNLFVQSAHGNGLNLTLTETSGFDDVNTFLLDRHTGELTALTAGTTIAVASDPTGLRYALVFPASVTGVKAATNVSLNLYPNPTTDVVYIEGLTADAAKGLRLTDLLGHELNVKVNAANGRHSIDLSNLSAGLYTVRVNGKGYQVVKK